MYPVDRRNYHLTIKMRLIKGEKKTKQYQDAFINTLSVSYDRYRSESTYNASLGRFLDYSVLVPIQSQ